MQATDTAGEGDIEDEEEEYDVEKPKSIKNTEIMQFDNSVSKKKMNDTAAINAATTYLDEY